MTRNKSTDTSCNNCAGGIDNSSGTADYLENTIVAGNTAANASASPDFYGAVVGNSVYNLIGDGRGTTGISNGNIYQNQVGTSANPIDPKLDPTLALNGGTTANHALLAGSLAIDKGNSSIITTTDQRGFTRPIDNPSITNAAGGDGADIGAFEVQLAPTAASVKVSGRVRTPNGKGLINAFVTLTDSSGSQRLARTSAFGYFHFEDVAAGETYIVGVFSKRYRFTPQVLSVNQDIADLELTGDDIFSGRRN